MVSTRFLLLSISTLAMVQSQTTEPYCDELTTTKAKTTTKPKTTTKAKTLTGWKCPTSWTKFSRTKGQWCIKVFTGTFTYEKAKAQCVAVGGVLSGVENKAERTFVINRGISILNTIGTIKEGALWVGALRRKECRGNNSTLSICVPAVNKAFYWTDGFTTGKSMMTWMPNQPDYYKKAEAAVQLLIVNKANGSGGAVSGQLNDVVATTSTAVNALNHIRGIVCGRKATAIYS
ncbi:unnamed protein product [Caenorhabditis angaria]|uniref:C-type lectin domain-containing protein n=1 Tax=Caenorhabditis angaria TaxID=860376 RepID=A0A9P1N852_9PELO|nr:unnamed protein product [Caenorhabditis angaria]